MGIVFVSGSGDRGSIHGLSIPKTKKKVHNSALFNIQHYKVQIKGKVDESMEKSSAFSYISVL